MRSNQLDEAAAVRLRIQKNICNASMTLHDELMFCLKDPKDVHTSIPRLTYGSHHLGLKIGFDFHGSLAFIAG